MLCSAINWKCALFLKVWNSKSLCSTSSVLDILRSKQCCWNFPFNEKNLLKTHQSVNGWHWPVCFCLWSFCTFPFSHVFFYFTTVLLWMHARFRFIEDFEKVTEYSEKSRSFVIITVSCACVVTFYFTLLHINLATWWRYFGKCITRVVDTDVFIYSSYVCQPMFWANISVGPPFWAILVITLHKNFLSTLFNS